MAAQRVEVLPPSVLPGTTQSMIDVGKLLIVIGLLIAAVGVVVTLAGRLPWLGRLPGDIYVQRGNWSFYFPLATSLVVSVVLTLLFWLLGRR
jgi:DUF2905 family protein